jgi:hypothetical protein
MSPNIRLTLLRNAPNAKKIKMGIEDTYMRKEIAVSIIERCRHSSPDQTPCNHCVEAAKLAWGDQYDLFENQVDFE